MIDQGSVPSLMGSTVRDSSGGKIGKVGQVYLDDTTGLPEWVTVRTGLFGTRESFVPLAAARVEGDELVVDVPKDRVTDAPKIDEDGHLSEEQEAELYGYYGISPGAFGRDTGPTGGYPADATTGAPYPPTGTGPADYDADGGADAGAGPVVVPTPAAEPEVPGEPAPTAAARARLRRYQAEPAAPADRPAAPADRPAAPDPETR